jgi:hypothetical protein
MMTGGGDRVNDSIALLLAWLEFAVLLAVLAFVLLRRPS